MGVAGIAAVAVLASACTPGASIIGFTGPNGAQARPWTVNEPGVAVGSVIDGGTSQAFTMDVATGQLQVLPPIPTQADFPAGGTVADARDINDAGDLLVGNANDAAAPSDNAAGDVAVAVDLADGHVTRLDCPAFTEIGRGLVTDDGLIVCGDHLLDERTGQAMAVPMPDGCNGVVAKVTDAGLVVGYCTAGTSPLFVTDRATGLSATFGDDLGITPSPSNVQYLGSFTETGYLIGTTIDGTLFVYSLQGTTATRLDLGPFDVLPSVGYAIDANGVMSVGAQLPNDGGNGIFDYSVTTHEVRGHQSDLDPMRIATPMGRNTSGQIVGFVVNPAPGIAYGAFRSPG